MLLAYCFARQDSPRFAVEPYDNIGELAGPRYNLVRMNIDVGLIGGTGIGEHLLTLPGRTLRCPTAHGWLSGRLLEGSGSVLYALSRHSSGHKVPPHLVNYRALAVGIKSLGAKACLSTAAVGSLRKDWPTGTLVLCDGMLDATGRNQTLFERTVYHQDMTHPFSPIVRLAWQDAANELSIPLQLTGTYLGANGPRYETPQEIRAYQTLGAHVVGMTASSEAVAMAEAKVPYACLAIVTNLAAGIADGLLKHGDVVAEMRQVGLQVTQLMLRTAELVAQRL